MALNDKLNFFVPIDSIEKSKDEKGNEVMKVKGVASTKALDSDGEMLDPNGFELKKFLKSGFINWQHQSTKNPNATIGEPTKAFIKNNEMHLEGFLYPSNPIAKSVYDMAKVLEKDSPTRRLGYSIEGSVIERDPNNPKIIHKAAISGVAICTNPKNPRTLMEVMKGEVESFDEFEYNGDMIKAIEADGGESNFEVTKKESLEGAKKKKVKNLELDEKSCTPLTKGEIYIDIFGKFTNEIEKAKQIYSLIQKINSMTETEEITKETIEKAHGILNMALEASSTEEVDLEKAEKAKEDFETAKAVFEKAKVEFAKSDDGDADDVKSKDKKMPKSGSTKGAKEEKQDGEGDEDGGEIEKVGKAEVIDSNSIIKGITDNLDPKFSAIGEILKGYEEREELLKGSIDAQGTIIKALGDRLNLVEHEKPARKAVTVSNYIHKGEDEAPIQKSEEGTTLSVSKDKAKLVDVLYNASNIEKGENINANFAKLVKIWKDQTLCVIHMKCQLY